MIQNFFIIEQMIHIPSQNYQKDVKNDVTVCEKTAYLKALNKMAVHL